MTPNRERFSLALPPPIAGRIRFLAEQRDISVQDAIRLALGIFDTCERARADGHYVGISRDRAVFDTVLVLPL